MKSSGILKLLKKISGNNVKLFQKKKGCGELVSFLDRLLKVVGHCQVKYQKGGRKDVFFFLDVSAVIRFLPLSAFFGLRKTNVLHQGMLSRHGNGGRA